MSNDKFVKVTHKIPMISLSNVFNEDEIKAFDTRVRKLISEPEYVCELKIDGLAMSIEYVDGKMNYGATRGNGLEGEVVTHNIKTIKIDFTNLF